MPPLRTAGWEFAHPLADAAASAGSALAEGELSADTALAGSHENGQSQEPEPTGAGWNLVSPSAVKLLETLRATGESGCTTRTHLTKLAGLGRRTIDRAAQELAALGWLSWEGQRGQGVAWRLLPVPTALTAEAAQLYEDQLTAEDERLAAKRARLALAKQK